MRAVLAILFGVLLLSTQFAQTGSAGVSKAGSSCPNCTCGKKACCVTRSAPAPQPQPAAPAGGVTAKASPWAPPATSCVAMAAATPVLQTRPASPAPLASGPVPLYKRNCAYLI